MKRLILIGIILIVAVASAFATVATHLDPSKVPFTCANCHSPHSRKGAGLLREAVPGLCFQCHGPNSLLPWASTDVYYDFQKKFHHPVQTTSILHRPTEEYPEKNPAAPRHVSCLDCHNVHTSTSDNPIGALPGYTIYGQKAKAQKDSEVCYKCHAEAANRPSDSEDMRMLFDPSNASFHPVETVAKNLSPSLKPGISGRLIKCIDCHNPHGSDYKGMLTNPYSIEDTTESPQTYSLCYKCHDRTLLFTDKTFPWHKRHVVYESISCDACHDPHGSPSYTGLVRFRTDVGPNAQGLLIYMKEGNSMSCYLNCHGVEHVGQQVKK